MDTTTILEMSQLSNFQKGKRITILGAGIAGLVAAYELERMGHEVDIMEASPRIGGRIWTHRFGNEPDAPYAELGAMRIPSAHQHTLHYVHKLGLSDKLCKFVTVFEEQNAFMNIQGKIFRMKDAPRILQERYQGIFTDSRYSEKTRLFAAWLKTIVDTISPGNLRESLEQDLQSHLMDELERLDLEPYFSEDGENIDLQSFIKDNPGFRARCSKAVDMFLSDILVETSHDLLQLKGGMDQLIQRLVQSIKAPIKCNQQIVAIRVHEDYTEIDWLENGQRYTRRCDYVLCTIPFSILRKMELSGFDDRKLDSIQNTIYCPATKVAFHTKEAFWQQQGINGGASFSGDGVRQTYYPSVNFNPNSGSVMLASYTIGDDADRLGNMSEEQRHSYVKNVVSQVHPELQSSDMVTNVASIAWGNYKWSDGGCTVHWKDDMSDEANYSINYLEAARPQNTLFFAGEHCSRYPAWLQGSIESALEAIYDIVSSKPALITATKYSLKNETEKSLQQLTTSKA
ncbi:MULTISPECIES: flavin monoamine oxidase family protein [Calothrix]|uniref:FAD-dependent oxidoreductase n=2 Tax=Calothrix TaxID=1186 RepID=A0ABR8A7P5_9CYAN|nr:MULTISPECIES: NAD(P)/FAD-dependent oxidoreductase [Calothrix]MBD2195505.1 FAD-dependent oxidoreductase [Calothrix parietina FACHB-288]MBD2228407.1 FAD-dependent oxidoreductase [Calothrix anomala FACHB-343]